MDPDTCVEFEALIQHGPRLGNPERCQGCFPVNLVTESYIVLQDEHNSCSRCSQDELRNLFAKKHGMSECKVLFMSSFDRLDVCWCFDML